MIDDFDSLNWHDAELRRIIVDREGDSVVLVVRWPDADGGEQEYLEFIDCYALKADMNFGMIPPDYVLEATCTASDTELAWIIAQWAKMGLDLTGLRCYSILTNSTSSNVKIYAKGCRFRSKGISV